MNIPSLEANHDLHFADPVDMFYYNINIKA